MGYRPGELRCIHQSSGPRLRHRRNHRWTQLPGRPGRPSGHVSRAPGRDRCHGPACDQTCGRPAQEALEPPVDQGAATQRARRARDSGATGEAQTPQCGHPNRPVLGRQAGRLHRPGHLLGLDRLRPPAQSVQPGGTSNWNWHIHARDSSTVATPLFLGTLTIFIPCGVTQAMMVLAVGTGSPILGAAIMFAFILGTTPVFFGLAYVATRLGEVLHTRFLQLAGAVVLILGLVSIEGGLNLMGSPYSFSNLLNAASVSLAEASGGSPEVAAQPDANGAITIQVYNTGYSPDLIKAPSGKPVSLTVVSNGTTGCTRGFVIPSIGYQRTLPETGQTTINIPASAANGNLRYTCSMGMYSGYFEFT